MDWSARVKEAEAVPLLPCPFCGRADVELICGDGKGGYERVSCLCGAEVDGEDPAIAVRKWNTRKHSE